MATGREGCQPRTDIRMICVTAGVSTTAKRALTYTSPSTERSRQARARPSSNTMVKTMWPRTEREARWAGGVSSIGGLGPGCAAVGSGRDKREAPELP